MPGAEALAVEVLAALSRPLKVGQHSINTTASLGIAFVGRDGSDVNEILKNADLAMYQAKTGGHIGPNLGVVELTIAMHYVFDTPKDSFVFDVSHQSYVHKLLTGREEQFHYL